MLVRLDDVDEVTVVTDTNESVEDDDVNDDKTELELLDDDDDEEEEENLSAGVSLPMWPSFCKTALISLPSVSLSSTYRWWPEKKKLNTTNL